MIVNSIKSGNYEGYIWRSNAQTPKLIVGDFKEDLSVKNPFIIEGQLYDKAKRVSYSIKFVDGEFENEYPFLLQNLNADSIDKLNEFIKTDALYYSEYKIDCTDALLTLITCTNSLNDDREIVIFKEIDK